MNVKSSLVIFAFVTVALVRGYAHDEDNGQAHYRFEYGVNDPNTHDIKSQYEERNGHHVLGGYNLREPDGTTRVVKYRAGPHTGFEAEVQRVGHAQHPGQYGYGNEGYTGNSFDGERQEYYPGHYNQGVTFGGANGNGYGYGQGQVNHPVYYGNQNGQGHSYGGVGGISYVGPVHWSNQGEGHY